MKFLMNLIKIFTPKEVSKPVGRWSIEQCNTKVNNRVDLSNEDHCGPCGQYILDKSKKDINEKNEKCVKIKPNATEFFS